ncbi:class I SAM-dependent methyltransferase [Pseudofrancisella aestuarii]|uniref:Class I SAM-dependent methyltransferase n=1 Tax=Pseudofrancisella aestuarii TaxID=2670347 RepID=A0ABV9TDA0_9GAMM|nr:SAM-dependent methyltransferase [Pseudofrancisella aestuarii]
MSLLDIVKKEIHKSDEKIISFRDFMNIALYYPGLGYYSSSKDKVSEYGDFITATSQTSIFATVFANQFADVLKKLGKDSNIVEFGAGTGKFAVDCMNELNRLKVLPKKYFIIELSNDLKFRQQAYVKERVPENLQDKFIWLTELPKEQIKGVVFANEVLDAMPVDIFRKSDMKIFQQGVSISEGELKLIDLPVNDKRFSSEIDKVLADGITFSEGYTSELNTWIKPWIKSISETLKQGVVFLCDYGYHRSLYYLPERNMGTLACYYRHKVNYDPFLNIGEQDITAHVDFTSVAEAVNDCEFEIEGYMTQANFLKRANVSEIFLEIRKQLDQKYLAKYSQDLKELLLGDKLAETFKVFCFSRGIDEILEVFDNDDNLDYLL